MNHKKKVMVGFINAIMIAEYKINEFRQKLLLNDKKEEFYNHAIEIGEIVKNIYSCFDIQDFSNLMKLNIEYGDKMIEMLDILESLVHQSIVSENEYKMYADSFNQRKKEYDILCSKPEKIKYIPLCECCIPTKFKK